MMYLMCVNCHRREEAVCLFVCFQPAGDVGSCWRCGG